MVSTMANKTVRDSFIRGCMQKSAGDGDNDAADDAVAKAFRRSWQDERGRVQKGDALVGAATGTGLGGIGGLLLVKLLAEKPELKDYLLGGTAGAVAGGVAGGAGGYHLREGLSTLARGLPDSRAHLMANKEGKSTVQNQTVRDSFIRGYMQKDAAFDPQSAAVGGAAGAGVGGLGGLVLTKLLAKKPELKDYLLGGGAGAVAGGAAGAGLAQTDIAQQLKNQLTGAGEKEKAVDPWAGPQETEVQQRYRQAKELAAKIQKMEEEEKRTGVDPMDNLPKPLAELVQRYFDTPTGQQTARDLDMLWRARGKTQ